MGVWNSRKNVEHYMHKADDEFQIIISQYTKEKCCGVNIPVRHVWLRMTVYIRLIKRTVRFGHTATRTHKYKLGNNNRILV